MHPSEKARLFDELSRLVRAGTPFPKAIATLAQLSHGQVRSSLLRIRDALDRGASVGDSLVAGSPLISPLEACVLTATDRAGRLDTGLEHASQYHAAIAGARARIRARLAYPVFIIHFALLILPLPMVFSENGGFLPFLKAAVLAIGGLWLCIFAIGAILGLLLSAAENGAAPDRLLRAVPVFGKLRRDFALARFCSAYHMQLHAGVNILTGLEMSGAASGSAILREAVASAMPAVRAGGQVGPALEKTRAFPALFIRAFAVGEQTGELDHEIQRLGEDCRTAAMRRLETISEWGPRLIYIGVICYIGWRIVSAYAGQMRDVQELMKQ